MQVQWETDTRPVAERIKHAVRRDWAAWIVLLAVYAAVFHWG